ncbi:MAG: hypothetical protein KAR06_12025 [Deltaproteobacteria bacterium]|nr:hypothetical protein [Deltaproteobacteria bacterium]
MPKNIIITILLVFIATTSSCFASSSSNLDKAINLFNQGSYDKALKIFKSEVEEIISRTEPNKRMAESDLRNLMASFKYLGLSYKLKNQYDLAIKNFNHLYIDSSTYCSAYYLGEIYHLKNEIRYAAAYWRGVFEPAYDTECMPHAFVMRYLTLKSVDDGIAEQFLKEPHARLFELPRAVKLIDYLRNEITAEKLIETTKNTDDKIFAYYVIGRNLLFTRKPEDLKTAKKYFEKALATNCRHCIGYDLSEKELKKLSQ